MTQLKDLYSESGTNATFTIGGGDMTGKLIVVSRSEDDRGTSRFWGSLAYDGETGTLSLGDLQMGLPGRIVIGATGSGQQILLEGAGITLGGKQTGNGKVTVRNSSGTTTAVLDGRAPSFAVGGGEEAGKLYVTSFRRLDQGDIQAWYSFAYDGETGTLSLGDLEMGLPGRIVLGRAGSSSQQILMEGPRITLGGRQAGNGNLTIKNGLGDDTIVLEGEHGKVTLGGGGEDGDVTIRDESGSNAIVLNGAVADLTLGGGPTSGDISLLNASGHETVQLDASNGTLTVGGVGVNGDILVKNDNDIETIRVLGAIGDIEFLNADVAEEFDARPDGSSSPIPGTVMRLDASGTLVACDQAYDGRVVGIVAGGGDYRPGIVLDRRGGRNRVPIALVGKAYCLADAGPEPIEVGDLLTTSETSGHAMRASDRRRAFGSVIGKALSGLARGAGLIPVLVMPQ